MITIPNYTIETTIHESQHTLVYRGQRLSDGQPVVLKTHRTEYPGPFELTKLKQDYDLGHRLKGEGIITYYGLERYAQKLFIIQEDFGAVSLKQEIPKDGFILSLFLDIAIQLAEALRVIHQQRIIHKDLKPANIVINPTTRSVKVIDFGIASQLSQETQYLLSPDHLEGTPAYLSPEQTGRMNRAIDYRTDFYSLGIVFYECLGGCRPFESDDPLELVHSHLARTPAPLPQLKPEIPPTISDIVMKLMAKNPEARYQSGQGLKADLLKCRAELDSQGKLKTFRLGKHDILDRFQIPQKLYGREREIEALLAAFERVSTPPNPPQSPLRGEKRMGGAEILLVTGYAGVGKSALVREIYKPITQKRGYFIAGKYDQLQRNVPYLAFSQAFNEFCAYLLTESEDNLAAWQEKLLTAVGLNGQLLIDLIPKLEQVIGPQPPVAHAGGPQETQNRLNLLFQNFVKAICQPQHPLVLFFDDLQWADRASLDLLQALMAEGALQHLLIIGAYRDNEVDPAHPLRLTLAAMEQAGIIVTKLELQNLSGPDVTALLADTLRTPKALKRKQNIRNLSALIYEKTQGNAFFSREFLKSLYQDNLITFQPDEKGGAWLWDIEQIRRQNITDNVVTLMAGKISKLPPETQRLLELAACLGNQFDLETLSTISQRQNAATEQTGEVFDSFAAIEQLWPAIQEGLILSLDNNYKVLLGGGLTTGPESIECKFKFAHDRIQQATYSLIEEADRAALHLGIGRLLGANIPPGGGDEYLFESANQFNQATQLITGEAEKIKVATLNLQAGQKAKHASAYLAAANYLKTGIRLLPDNKWQFYYALTFQLHKELAEAEYLTANFEGAEQLYPLLLQHAQSEADKLAVYNVQIKQLLSQSRYQKAIEVGRLSLNLLGITLPETEAEIQRLFELEQQALPAYLGERQISELAQAPLMTDEKQQALMTLLSNLVISASLSTQRSLLYWTTVKLVNTSLKYGHLDISAYGYISYCVHVLISLYQDYERAYQFGKLAVALSDKFDNLPVRGRVYNAFGAGIVIWQKHLTTGAPYLTKAYELCLEGGDFAFAGYAIFNAMYGRIVASHNLIQLNEEAQRFIPFLHKTSATFLNNQFRSVILQPIANLLGLTERVDSFDNGSFSERQFLGATNKGSVGQEMFYNAKIRCLYWFGFYQEALELVNKTWPVSPSMASGLVIIEAYFFVSLTLTANYKAASTIDRTRYEEILTTCQAQMKSWAGHCPDNFEPKYLLVEAERARLAGHFTQAMSLYKQAITSARQYNYLNHEALGNELYARFWLDQAEEEFAQIYMRRAHLLYQQWGATAKVKDLEEKYPRLLTWLPAQPAVAHLRQAAGDSQAAPQTVSLTTTSHLSLLDLNTLLKATQTISTEINLDKLLTRLMKIVIENAGAQRGYLILKSAGQLSIEAAATVEEVEILLALPLEQSQALVAESVVRYASRSGETVVLHNPLEEGAFNQDPYIRQNQPKSILCMPIRYREQIPGFLYLENNLIHGAFTEDRLELLNILLSQAAISLENARLYADLKQEVAERRQAQESLRASEERYRSIFENALIGISRTTPDGRFLDVNPAFAQMLGYTTDEVLQLKLPDDIYLEPAQRAEVEERGRSQGIFSNVEIALKKKDGTPIFVHIEGRTVRDEQGQTLFYEGVVQNITERKQAEEALKAYSERLEEMVEERTQALQATQEQLIQQEKLAVLGQLAGSVAHEIRNPLGVISNAIYFLQMISPDVDRTTQDYLDLIAERINDTEKIVFALLEFAHTRLPVREPVEVGRLIAEVLERNPPPEQVQVTTGIRPELPPVFVDATQLGQQVLANLVTNAYQAMPNGGELTISAQADSAWVRLSVADTGVGMSSETMGKIFEPLFTTKAKGIGLGLTISKNLVELNGGDITVNSEEGQGTIFTITLPSS